LDRRNATVSGPTPPGHRRERGGDAVHRLGVDVADEPRLAVLEHAVDADVDDDRARLDVRRAERARHAQCGDQHVGLAAYRREILRARVRERDGRVDALPREQQRERRADDPAAADDGHAPARERHLVVLEQGADPEWGAGDEARQAEREAAEGFGMEAVDVLGRRDRELQLLRGPAVGQRHLQQDPVHVRIVAQRGEARERLLRCAGCGNPEGAHHDARLRPLLFLACEVDLRGGLVADRDQGERRNDAPRAQRGGAARARFEHLRGERRPREQADLRVHAGLRGKTGTAGRLARPNQ
jgi:hypothetical protein